MFSRARRMVNMCKPWQEMETTDDTSQKQREKIERMEALEEKETNGDTMQEQREKIKRVEKWIHDTSVDVSAESVTVDVSENISMYPVKKINDVETRSCHSTCISGTTAGGGTRVYTELKETRITDPYEFVEADSEIDHTQDMSIYEFSNSMTKNASVHSIEILKENIIGVTLSNNRQHNEKQLEFKITDNDELSSSSNAIIDDDRDIDFDIDNCSEESYLSSPTTDNEDDGNDYHDCHIANASSQNNERFANRKEKSEEEKKAWCSFCAKDVSSRNFVRHMETYHKEEKEIEKILEFPKKSKQRRKAFELYRKETNFDLYISGTIRPFRQTKKQTDLPNVYYPCIYCKGTFKKNYLTRHSKVCRKILNPEQMDLISANRRGYMSESQTLVACAKDPTNVLSRLDVKEQVFNIMNPDNIAFEAKKDPLIVQYGECYLKKHKRERKEYACSNKMREISRLLIAYREIVQDIYGTIPLKDILKSKNMDTILVAVRKISGYDPLNKTFTAPSLAMHMGTHLKDICDLLIRLILKESSGFATKTKEESQLWLQDVKNFKELIESSWNIEVSSLANKDLQEKRWKKPLLVPLVSDIKKFRDETLKLARECEQKFLNCLDDAATFKTYVHCLLALVILFNRRRIGDVQYLKIKDYERERRSNFTDFKSALTDSENVLTKHYKRVELSGKGSRPVAILVPQLLQKFIRTLLQERKKYIPFENEYVFALPNSKIKWGQGDVAIRFLTQKIELKYPEAMSSNKLRKQIATVAQILNLSKDETRQFSKFMGHTEKTHAEFYELPVDMYQTAKVSKLLLLMEKGLLPAEYKGKSLAEIDFNANSEYADECDEDHEGKSSGLSATNENLISDNGASYSKADHDTEDFNLEVSKDLDPPDSLVSTKKKITKTSWSAKETDLINDNFAEFIENGNYPTSKQMKTFIEKTEINRSVQQLRSKIQHFITKKQKH